MSEATVRFAESCVKCGSEEMYASFIRQVGSGAKITIRCHDSGKFTYFEVTEAEGASMVETVSRMDAKLH